MLTFEGNLILWLGIQWSHGFLAENRMGVYRNDLSLGFGHLRSITGTSS